MIQTEIMTMTLTAEKNMRTIYKRLNSRCIADRGRAGRSGSALVCMFCLCFYDLRLPVWDRNFVEHQEIYDASRIMDGLFLFYGDP